MDINVNPKVAGYRDVTSTSRKNTISKKQKPSRVRSKALLGARSNGVVPFTAWVETGKILEPHHAIRDAQCEEKRLNEIIKAKEDKLKQFQHEVRKRVKALELRKQHEQIDKTYEAVETEQNIIHQSSFSRKLTLPTRDTCVYRDGSDLTIRGTSGSVVHDPTAVDMASKLLDKHANKIQQCSRHAREILTSKSAPVDLEKVSALPGGIWNRSPTRDHLFTSGQDCGFSDLQKDRSSTQSKELHVNEPLSAGGDFWVGQDEIKDMSFSDLESKSCHYDEILAKEQFRVGHSDAIPAQDVKRKVHFEDQSKPQSCKINAVKCSAPKQLSTMSYLIKPGQREEEKKKRTRCQMAVYRKLFMDLEREQVRENIRMKKHRHKMEQLKVEKEIERLTIENQELEVLAVYKDKDHEMKENIDLTHKLKKGKSHSEKQQKDKEMERYIDALRAVLKERLSQKRVELPPLCCCGPTIWDANPDTCANNCVFYKNPKYYAKALSSLLSDNL